MLFVVSLPDTHVHTTYIALTVYNACIHNLNTFLEYNHCLKCTQSGPPNLPIITDTVVVNIFGSQAITLFRTADYFLAT